MPAYALIVEPDPGHAQTLRHIAAAEGFEPRLARDGDAALLALRTLGAPGLTLIEPAVTRVDGFEVIAEIRKLAGPEQAPIVLISAFRNIRDAAVKLRDELGINALLARSSPVESVRRAVKKVLASSAAPHGPAQPVEEEHAPAGLAGDVDEDRVEELRLHHLDQMQLVTDDKEPQDAELRQIVEETAKQFGVPIATISLILDDRQWFKAHVGVTGHLLENRGSPRDWSFCQHVVQGRAPLVVTDAAVHPAFAQNKLVQEGALRSYAGAPLETPSGDVLGTLCIMDSKPMAISAEDVDELVLLARRVSGELELRSARRRRGEEQERLPPQLRADPVADKPLHTAMALLSAVLADVESGVFLVDPQGEVAFANEALAALFGVTVESLLGKDRDDLMRETAQQFSEPEDFLRRLRRPPTGPYALRGEFEMARPQRRIVRWTTKPVELAEGIGHLSILSDITAGVDLMREREQLARADAVTGLMNRRGAEDVLDREASRAQRFGARVSVALIDVDHFKRINDQKGQAAGDEVLRLIAGILQRAMRGVDAAARWDGDELLAILPATSLEGARSFAERVRAQVEALDPLKAFHATVSIGIAELQHGEHGTDAVQRASEKLHEAKDAGRNRAF